MRTLLVTLIAATVLSLPGLALAGQTEHDVADALSGPGTAGFIAVAIGLPLLGKDSDGKQQSLRALDALIASEVVSEALKRVVKEKRPDGSGETDSFPSGHATGAFAVAAIQAERHPDQAWMWYGGASLIAASRVPLKRHRVRDVVAGALLGYGMAQFELSKPHGLILQPMIQDDGGMGFYISKDL